LKPSAIGMAGIDEASSPTGLVTDFSSELGF
jgi:hypothetical protein